MKYPIVIANHYMQSAMFALSNPNNRSGHPHASAFLKQMYGTVTPRVSELKVFGWDNLNKAIRYRSTLNVLLERVILSEGREVPYPFSEHVARMMFPYVAHRKAQREDHRLRAKVHVDIKLATRKAENAEQESRMKFLSLPLSKMVDWLYDQPELFEKKMIRSYLNSYWSQHDKSGVAFSDLYPREVNWDNHQLILMVKNDIKI